MPTNVALILPTAAIGIKNLNVLPLSPQSSKAVLFLYIFVPSTVRTLFSSTASAPSALIQPIVALISFERATGEILLTPFAMAAQIMAL